MYYSLVNIHTHTFSQLILGEQRMLVVLHKPVSYHCRQVNGFIVIII